MCYSMARPLSQKNHSDRECPISCLRRLKRRYIAQISVTYPVSYGLQTLFTVALGDNLAVEVTSFDDLEGAKESKN